MYEIGQVGFPDLLGTIIPCGGIPGGDPGTPC